MTIDGDSLVDETLYLMINIHHLEDGGAVVGDSDVAIRADHQLVQSLWAKAGLQDVRHGLGRKDVRLDRIAACQPGLLHLVLEDHEGSAELVEGKGAHRHPRSSRPPHTRWHHHYEAGENLWNTNCCELSDPSINSPNISLYDKCFDVVLRE